MTSHLPAKKRDIVLRHGGLPFPLFGFLGRAVGCKDRLHWLSTSAIYIPLGAILGTLQWRTLSREQPRGGHCQILWQPQWPQWSSCSSTNQSTFIWSIEAFSALHERASLCSGWLASELASEASEAAAYQGLIQRHRDLLLATWSKGDWHWQQSEWCAFHFVSNYSHGRTFTYILTLAKSVLSKMRVLWVEMSNLEVLSHSLLNKIQLVLFRVFQ